MNIFKKKENNSCCNTDFSKMNQTEFNKDASELLILGSGCAKCQKLTSSVMTALEELQLQIPVRHVTDFAQIAAFGVMSTPAIVYKGKLLSYGKVLSVEECKQLLTQTFRKNTHE